MINFDKTAHARSYCDTDMASAIKYHDQFFYVSNTSFFRLVEFGLEVGANAAEAETEKSLVSKLREKKGVFHPGYDFAIEHEFPLRDERKFWARVYFDVAHLIFRGQLGNHEVNFWQSSAIGEAYLFARLIVRSVQEEEMATHPKTMASIEHEGFYHKGLSVKL